MDKKEWRNKMNREFTGVTVKLIGTDGNIFSILAKVRRAMRSAGIEQARIERFTAEVQSSSSYDEALQVVLKYVEVE